MTVHRDPRNFSPQTDGFWPERWLPEAKKLAEAQGQEYIHNPQAYFPFAFG
jgi:cytochrome P450